MPISRAADAVTPARFHVATLLALTALVVRDAASPRVGWYLVAGCALVLLPWLLADALALLLPAARRHGVAVRRISLALLFAVPPSAAALALGTEAAKTWPWALPAEFTLGAIGAVAGDRLLARIGAAGAEARARGVVCLAVAVLQVLAALLLLHAIERTFLVMREGREDLHHQLFAASWLASIGLTAIWCVRLLVRAELELPRWLRRGAAAVAIVGGVALMEADRRVLVDLQDGLHIWLALAGVLSVDAGISLLIARLRRPVLARAGAASLVTLLIAAGSFPALNIEDGSIERSEVAEAPVGMHLVDRLSPHRAPGPVDAIDDATAAALEFPRYHDAPGLERRFNILLIVVDTLRADQVGGAAAEYAPRLARLAADSVHLRRAYATATRTVMSMGTVLMAKYPANLDWRLYVTVESKRRDRLFRPRDSMSAEDLAQLGRFFHQTNPRVPSDGTVAERLAAVGYHTMAVPYVGRGLNFAPELGYDAGFAEYPDLAGQIWPVPTSTRIAKMALEQIDRAPTDRPWFQWVHMYDPHETKSAARYPRVVAHMDDGLGVLLDGLAERGLDDDTIVVFVADHGEGFGEHRQRSHASSLFDDQLRIPMLFDIPGFEARTIDAAVSLVDVPATILAAGGADLAGADGVNLLPLLRDDTYPQDRPIFAELHRWRGEDGSRNRDMKAVIRGDYKLIHDRLRGSLQLYDLASDPAERDNLLASERDRAVELAGLLRAWVGLAEAAHPLPDPVSRPGASPRDRDESGR